VVKAYAEDPMVLQKGTARWGAEALDAVDWVKQNPERMQIPLLILHGEDDPINTVQGARTFFDQIRSKQKEFRTYPGSLHEAHNDYDHPQVAKDILEWLKRFV
jgi:alpha-beta hydrolase superfamily lysophospholipase